MVDKNFLITILLTSICRNFKSYHERIHRIPRKLHLHPFRTHSPFHSEIRSQIRTPFRPNNKNQYSSQSADQKVRLKHQKKKKQVQENPQQKHQDNLWFHLALK